MCGHMYTRRNAHSHTCTHTKTISKSKRNAKYLSLQLFWQSSKPAWSSDLLDGWFMKATTREAYRGSRLPSFPEQEEFSTWSDDPERKGKRKAEEEDVLGSREMGSSTRPASQGMGKRAAGSHLPSSSSLFFVFTLCALQGVRNFSVFPPITLSQHFSSSSAHLQDGDLLAWKLSRISSSNTCSRSNRALPRRKGKMKSEKPSIFCWTKQITKKRLTMSQTT